MDSIDQLLHLRQGGLSIEEYVHQFCELSFQVPLYDEILFKDLFHFGHIKSLFHESLFPGGEFNGSLRGLMDCVPCCMLAPHLLWVSRRRTTAPSQAARGVGSVPGRSRSRLGPRPLAESARSQAARRLVNLLNEIGP